MARGLSQQEVGLVVGGLGVGIAAGFGLGYRMGQVKVWALVDQTVEEELTALRDRYKALQDEMVERHEAPDPEELVASYGDPGPSESVITVTPTESVGAVFDKELDNDPGPEVWNYQHELSRRNPEEPYVIHIDEFTQPPADYDRMSVTWFEDDDTMIDGRDIPIDDMDGLVGLGSLEKFGHGSENPHTVYVRNELLKLDIEVTKSAGTLAEHMGVSPPPEDDGELRHSSDRRLYDDER